MKSLFMVILRTKYLPILCSTMQNVMVKIALLRKGFSVIKRQTTVLTLVGLFFCNLYRSATLHIAKRSDSNTAVYGVLWCGTLGSLQQFYDSSSVLQDFVKSISTVIVTSSMQNSHKQFQSHRFPKLIIGFEVDLSRLASQLQAVFSQLKKLT